jgi:RNA recognition motif-containing protein
MFVDKANLFVQNFPFSATESSIADYFESRGFRTTKIHLVTDPETGKAKGYGFVTLEDETQNDEAIAVLHDKDFAGRRLTVRPANPRKPR